MTLRTAREWQRPVQYFAVARRDVYGEQDARDEAVVHREPLLPTNDHSNLSGSDRLRYRAATCWHVGGLSCSVSEDASHNHDSNETGNYAANAPFPVPRIIWVPDAIIVSVRHD
jgi:hypothetical protein